MPRFDVTNQVHEICPQPDAVGRIKVGEESLILSVASPRYPAPSELEITEEGKRLRIIAHVEPETTPLSSQRAILKSK